MEKYDANLRVSAYAFNFPYNYEDRLQKLPVGGRKTVFYTASLEDIVIAKLYSNRPSDRQDLISEEVLSHLNWASLRRLAPDENEARANAMNDRAYRDFLYDYRQYAKRYGPDESAYI